MPPKAMDSSGRTAPRRMVSDTFDALPRWLAKVYPLRSGGGGWLPGRRWRLPRPRWRRHRSGPAAGRSPQSARRAPARPWWSRRSARWARGGRGERRRVVEGERLAVRVDVGGGGILEKKNKD